MAQLHSIMLMKLLSQSMIHMIKTCMMDSKSRIYQKTSVDAKISQNYPNNLQKGVLIEWETIQKVT